MICQRCGGRLFAERVLSTEGAGVDRVCLVCGSRAYAPMPRPIGGGAGLALDCPRCGSGLHQTTSTGAVLMVLAKCPNCGLVETWQQSTGDVPLICRDCAAAADCSPLFSYRAEDARDCVRWRKAAPNGP